jgi:hypothetical protein
MLVGFNIKADFSMRGQFAISGSQPGPAGVSGVDHFYDDGYVRVDQTGNAQGYTSYWGYDNAAQYNSASHTLLMHSTTSFTASQNAQESDNPYFGFDLAYGPSPWRWGETKRLGFEVGFGFLPIRIKDDQPTAAILDRAIYSFDTANIVMPTAPYHGGPSGIGPTIHDTATALPGVTAPGTITGSRTLAVDLVALRLGPSLYWALSDRFALSIGFGGALGIIPGNLKYDETITSPGGSTTHNQGQVGSTQITYGGYAGATFLCHLMPHADAYLGAQFMPMASTTFEGQGRQARLNMDGQVFISAGLNWPF